MKMMTIWNAFRQADYDARNLREIAEHMIRTDNSNAVKTFAQFYRRDRQMIKFADRLIDFIANYDEVEE